MNAADRWGALYEPQVFEGMPCRVMKPLAFDSKKSYPVIVSLHGAGGKGTNNDKQLKDWNRQLAEGAATEGFPLLRGGTPGSWFVECRASGKKIKALIKGLPSVDMDRIYIMGHSMGGHGTYIFIQLDPLYFAAAAPSAGSGRKTSEGLYRSDKNQGSCRSGRSMARRTVSALLRKDQRGLGSQMKKLGGNMKLTTLGGRQTCRIRQDDCGGRQWNDRVQQRPLRQGVGFHDLAVRAISEEKT